jgi:hypothetical protein
VGTPAAAELAFPAASTYAGGSQIIQSPFQFIADADTFLRVISACSVAGVTVAVQGRRLDDQGQLQTINETHTPFSTRVTHAQDIALGPGALLNLSLSVAAGAPLMGQCYVKVHIMRNMGATAIVLGTILGGCITSLNSLGFPGSAVVSSLESEPVVRYIQGTTVGSGVDVAETVPTGARWELLSFNVHATFSTTTVALVPILRLESGGNLYCAAVAPQIAQGSYTSPSDWCWVTGYSQATPGAAQIYANPFPQTMKLLAGVTIRMPFLNIGWSATPRYIVREWLDL